MSKFIKTSKVQAFFRKWSSIAKSKTATITIPAGAKSAMVNFYIPIAPVSNSNGNDIGGFGNSSLSFATGVFTTEVSSEKKDADMAAGEYWIDYLTGRGRGCKLTAGTSESVTWKYFVPVDSDAAPTTPQRLQKLVVTPGTQVQLIATATPFRWATIQAQFGNGAYKIYLGKSDVDKADGTTWACVLTAGMAVTIPLSGDLSDYWIDIDTGGDGKGVNVFYLT